MKTPSVTSSLFVVGPLVVLRNKARRLAVKAYRAGFVTLVAAHRRRRHMLVAILYTPRDTSEEKEKRSLNMFTNWKPPAGYEFKAHYALVDGGGIAIAEVNSPAVLLEAHAPWGPYFEFRTVPVVEIDKAVAIFQRVNSWRDSVK
jgi:hypothetical protein